MSDAVVECADGAALVRGTLLFGVFLAAAHTCMTPPGATLYWTRHALALCKSTVVACIAWYGVALWYGAGDRSGALFNAMRAGTIFIAFECYDTCAHLLTAPQWRADVLVHHVLHAIIGVHLLRACTEDIAIPSLAMLVQETSSIWLNWMTMRREEGARDSARLCALFARTFYMVRLLIPPCLALEQTAAGTLPWTSAAAMLASFAMQLAWGCKPRMRAWAAGRCT